MQLANKKILILAFILALVTSFIVYSYIKGMAKQPKQAIEYASVVVAVKNLDEKAVINSGDVKVIKVEKPYANSRAFTSVSEVTGKRIKDKIIAGEQVLKDRLVTDEQKSLLSYSVPKGKRAVTVNVNEAIEVGDFIRPGDYVDILATFDKLEIEDNKSKVVYPKTTRVVLQNVLILGLGQLQDVPEKPRQDLPKTVTLAVSLDEAEKLALAEESGVLKMALRRTDDHDIVTTPGIIRQDLVTERGKIELIK